MLVTAGSVIIHVKKYIHPPFDICLLGRICREAEADRNTSERSVPCNGGHGVETTYWLLALASPLSGSLAFAVAKIAVVLFIRTFAIVFVLVLIGISVALRLLRLLCRLWAT